MSSNSTKAKPTETETQNRSQRCLEDAVKQIAPIREKLMQHEVYRTIESSDDLRIFMEYHVFAVWDFMSLLKTLQSNLTCVTIPWLPPKHPAAARLINEIVLAEESDCLGEDRYISHFELYKQAMRECGADTNAIDELIANAHNQMSIREALKAPSIPPAVRRFVNGTWDFIESKDIWITASAFAFGREEIIPDMFRNFDLTSSSDLVHQAGAGNSKDANCDLTTLRRYLELHIITDETHHVKLAFSLLKALCEDDQTRWHKVVETAEVAITRRIELWDGVTAEILRKRP